MRGHPYDNLIKAAHSGVAIQPITHDGDNFAQRRAATESAGVPYDPESLLTGEEMEAGLDYDDARDRGSDWSQPGSPWQRALAGKVSSATIPQAFPRKKGMMYNQSGEYIPREQRPYKYELDYLESAS